MASGGSVGVPGADDELLGAKVVGLRELRAAMRRASAGTQHAIQVRLKGVAQLVASEAAGRVPVSSGKATGKGKAIWPKTASGSARASIRAVATTERATVIGGGPRAPYFPWLDFGGSTGIRHRDHVAGSGAIARDWYGRGGGGGGEGRFIYPAVREMHDVIVSEASAAVHDALRDAGWEPG